MSSLHHLPPAALAAYTRLYPKERLEGSHGAGDRHLADLGLETAALELQQGRVALSLARDCPFGEISPAYLAIFVYRLAALCPEVGVAYLPGYYHPIVATLPLEVPIEAPDEAWSAAIQATVSRLEAALDKQRDAARGLSDDGPGEDSRNWPEVAVTTEQLEVLGQLADDFAKAQSNHDLHAIGLVEERLHRRLRSFGILKPERSWIGCLRLEELHSGFWSSVRVEQFSASQLVVTLNALYEGNRYNTTLVEDACCEGLLGRITARARQLSTQ